MLLLICAAAVVLRIQLADRALWFDELITVLKAKESMTTLLDGLADDVHPPLFYALTNLWAGAFGTGPLVIRTPSIVWSAVAIVATWSWSREAFPHHSGLPAAFLGAFAPFAVWYGTEVRMYAQILGLTAIAGWAAWRLLGRGASVGRVSVLVTSLIALSYTHYFASLFTGALLAIALAGMLWHPSALHAYAWLAAGCTTAMASLLPWFAFVLERRSSASPDPTRYPVPDFYSVVMTGTEIFVGFYDFDTLGLLAACWPLLALVAILLLRHMASVSWRVAGLLALICLPAAVLVAVSVVGPRSAFDPRFLTVCAIPLYVLAGAIFTGRRGLFGYTAGVVLVGLAVVGAVWQNSNGDNPKLYDYKGATVAVNARADRGDAVLLLPNFGAAGHVGEPVFDYYPLRPGLLLPNTKALGQDSVNRVRTGLETIWGEFRRTRPEQVFVVDTYAEHTRGEAAARATHAFIGGRADRTANLPYAHARVQVYRPRWKDSP